MAGSILKSWVLSSAEGGESLIRVGRGISGAEELVPPHHRNVAVLTQPSVASVAKELADEATTGTAGNVHVVVLPDGDAAKDMGVVADIYERLNRFGFTRDDLVVAVGGGALTDTAGFIAATYLRGVTVTYLSTTLLGAVDAAIGGKTGVNVGGKNLAGVFRHPSRVVVDLDILDNLPRRLLCEGAAEAVKAGFIAEPTIVAAYEAQGLDAPLDVVVPEAIGVKVRTVEADFREGGLRAILNYGHTIGHAVELAAGISHGEAVAIGMVAAGRISESVLGFAEAARQRDIIAGIGLPVSAPGDLDAAEVIRLIHRDKKRDAGGLRMVLLESLGRPVLQYVGEDLVQLGLREIGVGKS
jgi:3-dehydroquinate synthase